MGGTETVALAADLRGAGTRKMRRGHASRGGGANLRSVECSNSAFIHKLARPLHSTCSTAPNGPRGLAPCAAPQPQGQGGGAGGGGLRATRNAPLLTSARKIFMLRPELSGRLSSQSSNADCDSNPAHVSCPRISTNLHGRHQGRRRNGCAPHPIICGAEAWHFARALAEST